MESIRLPAEPGEEGRDISRRYCSVHRVSDACSVWRKVFILLALIDSVAARLCCLGVGHLFGKAIRCRLGNVPGGWIRVQVVRMDDGVAIKASNMGRYGTAKQRDSQCSA
jgi:hypothetical protein